jgi:hypothetical protein
VDRCYFSAHIRSCPQYLHTHMKRLAKFKLTVIIVSFVLIGCEKVDEKNTYIFKNGSEKVEFKIRNGNDYLEFDKNLKTDFILTNVDHRKFMVAGAGISVRGTKNDTMRTEIKVPKEYAKNDTLSIKIRYGETPYVDHEFKIPVRNAK